MTLLFQMADRSTLSVRQSPERTLVKLKHDNSEAESNQSALTQYQTDAFNMTKFNCVPEEYAFVPGWRATQQSLMCETLGNVCVTCAVAWLLHLAEVWVSLSINLWMFFPLLFSLGAAGCQFWSRFLYHLTESQNSSLVQQRKISCWAHCPHLIVVWYPLVLDDFADVDSCLGVLSEVPLLLEKETLSALPTQIWTNENTFKSVLITRRKLKGFSLTHSLLWKQ